MRKLMLAVCAVTAGILVSAFTRQAKQAPPAPNYVFEVATLKQNTTGERGGGIRRLPGGRVTVTNMPARGLVAFAYQLGQWPLIGGPGWLADDRFDIIAKRARRCRRLANLPRPIRSRPRSSPPCRSSLG